MNRSLRIVLALAVSIAAPCGAFARGFGGFHGGGGYGGYHGGSFGGYGGYHGGGFEGGYHAGGFESGGFHEGGYGGYGGYHAGGFESGGYHTAGYGGYHAGGFEAGGFHEGGWGGGSVNRGQLNSFLGLPTDGGMHAAGGAYGSRGYAAGANGAAAWRGGASAHEYQGPAGTTVVHGTAGVRGTAVGPGGMAAGGRVATGTAIEGPRGNTYTHTASAGRGVAAGPNGVEAGRYASSSSTFHGANGTQAWSATYCHSQAVAAHGWCAGRGIYSGAWCAAHPWAWCPVGYAAADWAAAAWAPATWAMVGTWLGTAAAPYTYNYGNDITYQDNTVYYGTQPAGSAQQYYQEAANLAASSASATPADDAQWLPLGVFGLMAEGKKKPDMVFQLAVDKNGVLRGNYFDQVTQTNLPVTGQVDKKTQRVAWSVGSGKEIVVETGLANLTQDESTALVHFGPDQTQQEVLVRMKPSSQNGQ